MGRAVDVPLQVRYAETDAQGVVYHSNFIIYFEVGRVGLMEALGLDYRELEAQGQFLVVVEAHCRYRAPARFGDRLVVRTRIRELRTRSLTFAYDVLRGEEVLAEGWTAHMLVGRDGKATPLPEPLRQQLEATTVAP